ncbi:Cytochrome P450 4C1 [Blattella germanica]|nr:Cytochrome P450 4C1 [Blattella germanica]
MFLGSALLALVTFLALYTIHHFLHLWRFLKKVEKLPTTKTVPILGHAHKFLVPRNQVLDVVVQMAEKEKDMFTVWMGPIPVLAVINPRAKWQSHRKMLTPAFHFSILDNFVEVFAEKSQILLKMLEKEAGSDDFDVFPYISSITNEVMRRMLMPWLYPDFIYYLTPAGRREKKYLNILHGFTYKDDIIPGLRKKLAFLDILLEASEKGSKLTDEEIREEVDTFMFEEKIYEELNVIFDDSDRTATTKDLNEMKYLERVIKEGLRRYPSVPAIGRVLKEDIEYDGHTIPAGMRVVLLVGFVHHNVEQYNESEIIGFDPDNFLPENVAKRHPYSYVPFSAGPRNCIGQKFALLEEKMVLSSIVRNYKWEVVGDEPEPLPELILRPNNGIHIKLTKRHCAPSD